MRDFSEVLGIVFHVQNSTKSEKITPFVLQLV
jgi:hypothetical protein